MIYGQNYFSLTCFVRQQKFRIVKSENCAYTISLNCVSQMLIYAYFIFVNSVSINLIYYITLMLILVSSCITKFTNHETVIIR